MADERKGTAATKAKNKYNDKTYDRINFVVLKGQKQVIADYAAKDGKSINGYIKSAIKGKIKADTGDDISL